MHLPGTLYSAPIRTLAEYIELLLEKAAGESDNPLDVFFRADDIGVPSSNFSTMADLFLKWEMPLCLAIVPSWLTTERRDVLFDLISDNTSLFCLHQHGWLHKNFEPMGKKQEFGPARNKETLKASLEAGKKRLEELLGDQFSPCFTPPWNRCCPEALESLNELGFKLVSGSSGTLFPSTPPLINIPVNIDLHTGKEKDQQSAIDGLIQQFQQAGKSGQLGIMLHHQRMNANAFALLEILLKQISLSPRFEAVHFDHMVP